jgi:acetyl esterase
MNTPCSLPGQVVRAFSSFLFVLLAGWPAVAAEPKGAAPDVENAAYGPHERNVLDLWKAKSDKPTALLVFIHGGGFINGDKSQVRGRAVIRQCLDAGVSFASINYRFREHAPIQDILRDAARAIQYIRSRAADWNIDPARIACYGGSAGAGTSLWLAFHDDLADPQSSDPVLRQSTRLAAAGSLNGQVSYDLRDWVTVLGASPFQRPESERLQFYRFASAAEEATAEADKIMKDCSMIGLISADDPPVAVACSMPSGDYQDRGHYVHHPKHSTALADRCKQSGIECLLILSDKEQGDRVDQTSKVVAFLIEKLRAGVPVTPAAAK